VDLPVKSLFTQTGSPSLRNNSFDLIRHIAALMVLVSHHFVLAGRSEPGIPGYSSWGGIAVTCFFAISGLLITLSFLHAASVQDYLAKRVARIFPALIACSFLMTFVAGAFFASDYVLGTAPWLDFLRISFFGRANIEAITDGFIFSESFNGSLWTLKIEFAFYLLLALMLKGVRSAWMPWLALGMLGVATYVLSQNTNSALAHKFTLYGAAGIAFFLGSVLAFHRNRLKGSGPKCLLLALGTVLIVGSTGTSFVWVAATLGIALATLSVGLLFVDPCIKGRFDISYGMYLYAFPVQQLIINKTALGFYPSMAVTTVAVIGLATLSWLLIEQPALRFVHRKNTREPAQGNATTASTPPGTLPSDN